jgi:hypothetical protein
MHLGHGQDAVAVQVQLGRQVHHLAIAPARDDDGDFSGQRQHFSSTQGTCAQLLPGGGQFFARFHADLALAVVAHSGGLEDAGQQVVAHRRQMRRFDHRIRGTSARRSG